MPRKKHETLSLTTVASPVGTAADVYGGGCAYVLFTANANCRFTVDGETTPIITASSEVGVLLGPTGDITSIILTAEEFDDLKIVAVTGTVRAQFDFLDGNRLRGV